MGEGVHRGQGHRLHGNEDQVPAHQAMMLLDIEESFHIHIVILPRIMILRNMGMIQTEIVGGRKAHHILTLHEVDINKDITILLTLAIQSQTMLLLNEVPLPLQPDSNLNQTLNP